MKIIVVCTGNSCRSQMAEGLIKNRFPEFEVFSAEFSPTDDAARIHIFSDKFG